MYWLTFRRTDGRTDGQADWWTDQQTDRMDVLYVNVLCCVAATEQQTEDGREQVEHYVMSHIYTHAMYPNADIDFMRDQ